MLRYITLTSGADLFARTVIAGIGQLMVTVFFFYSGYGIMEAFARKPDYLKGFFKNRILKTLVHFDLAVLLYLALDYILPGSHYPLDRTLLAFTGWTSIGNSNWFVFCTLALYLLTLLAFAVFRKNRGLAVATVCVLTAGLIVFLALVKEDYYWYNTLVCYPLGMLWSLGRGGVEKTFAKKLGRWWAALAALVVSVAGLAVLMLTLMNNKALVPTVNDLGFQSLYMLLSCAFCLLVAVSQMRLRTQNAALNFLGVNAFSIYILQRLPMLVLKHFGLNANPLLFIPLAFGCALLIAPAFTWLTNSLDKLLFPRKKA